LFGAEKVNKVFFFLRFATISGFQFDVSFIIGIVDFYKMGTVLM
jgi:hypothetical protein